MSSIDLLAEPIRRYIYDKRWDSFRPIQESAILNITTTSDNYILSSKTASGKTEAAFLPTRMTTTQRDALTAANGMVLYNTSLDKLQAREGGAWVTLSNSSGGTFVADAGTAGAPSYTFTGDLDTGIYHSAANTIDFSTGGARQRKRADVALRSVQLKAWSSGCDS